MATKQLIQPALKAMAVVAMLCLGPLCFGESLVVRVVNGATGEPISKQLVTIHLRYGRTAAGADDTRMLRYTTDSSGEAVFQLSAAKPRAFEVEVDFAVRGLSCSCRVVAQTETVLREGLLAHRAHSSKTSAAIQPRPGQIVFIARPSSFLAKVLYDY